MYEGTQFVQGQVSTESQLVNLYALDRSPSHNLHKVVPQASSGSHVQVDECGEKMVCEVKMKKEMGSSDKRPVASGRKKEMERDVAWVLKAIKCSATVPVTHSSSFCPRLIKDALVPF